MKTTAYYIRAREPPAGETVMWASILLVVIVFFFLVASSFLPAEFAAWR
jgi:hypothetical protein